MSTKGEIDWRDASTRQTLTEKFSGVPETRHGHWKGYTEPNALYAEAKFEGLNAKGVPLWTLTIHHADGNVRRYTKSSYGACRREAETQLRIDRRLKSP